MNAPSDGRCLFHSLCMCDNAPYKYANTLKKQMRKHLSRMEPFETSYKELLTSRTEEHSFDIQMWKQNFKKDEYWGTEFDMAFYTLLYNRDIICHQPGTIRNHTITSSSYALLQLLIDQFDLPPSLLPARPKATDHVYLHVAGKMRHAPGYFIREIDRWVWSLTDVNTAQQTVIEMKLNHFAALFETSPCMTYNSFVYKGGPSPEQQQSQAPELLDDSLPMHHLLPSLNSIQTASLPVPGTHIRKSLHITLEQTATPNKKARNSEQPPVETVIEAEESPPALELCTGNYEFENIIEHKEATRGTGASQLLSIKWKYYDEPTWERACDFTDNYTNETATRELAEYVQKNNLLNTKGFKNLKKYLPAVSSHTRSQKGISHCYPALLEDTDSSFSDNTFSEDKDNMTVGTMDLSNTETDSNGGHGIVQNKIQHNQLPFCNNCHRTQSWDEESTFPYILVLEEINLENYRKAQTRTFCFVEDWSFQNGYFCTECKFYMDTTSKAPNTNAAVVWPAFIWSVLRHEEHYEKAWELLSALWQPWWANTVATKHNIPVTSLLTKVPNFQDVSTDLDLDLAAIEPENLSWKNHIMPRELSFTLPNVKCPAGCSEWKHKCNNLPLDIVWEWAIDSKLSLYSNRQKCSCTNWFRDDYLKESTILFNPDWVCKASYAMNIEQHFPEVLCCRFHNSKNKQLMIHPPANPTGAMFNEKANQFAPVVPIPRTIQHSKAHNYAASFRMVSLEGSYEGIDTMYLSQTAGFHYYQSQRGWKREVLATKGRTDIRAHVTQLKEQKIISEYMATRLLGDSDRFFQDWEKTKQTFQKGANFISVDDAVRLHQGISYAGTESAVVKDDDNNRRNVSFAAPWPRHLTWVHPSGNPHGRKFPDLLRFKRIGDIDTRSPWILCAMIVTLPDIWNEVVQVRKRDWEWEGWVLMAVSRNCLPQYKLQHTSSNPFSRKLNFKDLVNEYIQPPNTSKLRPSNIHQKFLPPADDPARYSGILSLLHQFTEPKDPKTKVVIVTKRNSLASRWSPVQQIKDTLWELRFLAVTTASKTNKSPNTWKGTIYCRHGTSLHPLWWSIDRDSSTPEKKSEAWTSTNLEKIAKKNWTVCVYIRNQSFTPDYIRHSLLEACGGQSKAYCHDHQKPLISVPNRVHCKCCCNTTGNKTCSKNAIYMCSDRLCKIAICKQHFCSIHTTDQKFMIGKNGVGTYGPHPRENNTEDEDEDHNSIKGDSSGNESLSEPRDSIQPDDELVDNTCKFQPDPLGNGYDSIEARFLLEENIEFNEEESTGSPTNHIQDPLGPEVGLNHETELDEDELLQTHLHGLNDDTDCLDHTNPNDNFYIPTTNAGLRPIYTVIENEPYKNSYLTNHALLNVYGGCLVRRKEQLKGTTRQRNFLQRLVTAAPMGTRVRSLPLLYPEGMLFTDIFYLDEEDGSIVGALPAALLHNATTLKQYGFAPLIDHYRARMSHPGLLTSTNPKYHCFAFDNLVNLGMRGCDSRIILRRGFVEFQQKEKGVRIRGREEPIFDSEHIDCRPVVNKLAAAIGEDPPAYFYTHTCNMREGFGMRLIWKWLTSEDLMDAICDGSENENERHNLRKSIIDSAGVLLLRCWMELNQIWILYITKSKDRPLGEIKKFVLRAELQEAKANLPHFHSILWTTEDLDTEEGLAIVLDRIRGYVLDIIRDDEKEKYIQDGIFKNEEAILTFLEMISTVLRHKHRRRCFAVAKHKSGDGYEKRLHCKVPDNYKLNPSPGEHSFIDIPITHSQEAIHVMQEIGVAKKPPESWKQGCPLQFQPLVKSLIARKHVPPAHGHEGIISPVAGTLVAINPSSDNLQFPTGYTLSRYLAKYVLSVDTYNVLKIKPPTKNDQPDTYRVEGQMLLNTKVTSNKIAQKDQLGSQRTPRVIQGRGVNIVETYMYLYGYDPIITDIPFVNIPLQPFEERAATERCKPVDTLKQRNKDYLQGKALTALNTMPSHHARTGFQAWRQFTPSQIRKALDDMHSPLSTDFVTIFGFRPPELRFVMHQIKYARWFKRSQNKQKLEEQVRFCKNNIHTHDLERTSWIDASTGIILLRRHALPEVIQYLITAPPDDFGGIQNKHMTERLFQRLGIACDYYYDKKIPQNIRPAQFPVLEDLCHRFICEETKLVLPVPWFMTVRPTVANRFLISLLLSLGAFVDEYDLFSTPSLRHTFVKARLLNNHYPLDSAKSLMTKYFLEQLVILPAGTRTFDLYCVTAFNTIKDLFVHDRLYSNELPTVLYCRLQQDLGNACLEHQKEKQETLVNYLTTQLSDAQIPGVPPTQKFLDATLCDPITFDITNLRKSPQQPNDSYHEQKKLLALCKNQIDCYKSSTRDYTKGVCSIGAGGVGKTLSGILCSLLYAAGAGLSIATTALMSERGKELAGEHINSLFCIPQHDHLSPGQLAERAISALFRSPEKLEFLRTMDCLGVDEGGCVPGEVWSIMDTILRYIRNSSKPFGGLLIYVSMDNLQIDPCKGKHPLLCPLFVSCFLFRKLIHSVRAAFDLPWQQIQAITRMTNEQLDNPVTKEQFIDLLLSHCRWAANDTDKAIPRNALYVFGKNAPIREEEKKLFHRLSDIDYQLVVAEDEERTIEGNYIRASAATTTALNRKVKEPEKLYLYQGGRYQITYNKRKRKRTEFSNTQLAILFAFPDVETTEKKGDLKLLVAPPGNKYIPDENDTEEVLLALGWKYKAVGVPPGDRVQFIKRGIRAKRRQYGLRHHVGSTIHAAMGATLKSLVTKILKGRKSNYSLWLKSQVVVLLSRTRFAKETVFLSTNPRETAEALYDILLTTTPFETYISQLLESLCTSNNYHDPPQFNMTNRIYTPATVSLPTDNTGQVYLLVSCLDTNFVYIGSTRSIIKRLREHNSGFGSNQTAPPSLRPWGLLAYVNGFDGDRQARLAFENKWIQAKENYLSDTTIFHSTEGILNLGMSTIQKFNTKFHLRLIRCGTLAS